MTLDQGVINGRYIVESLHLPLKLEKRLEALGMTNGTSVSVLNAKNHGTLIIKVRGTRFAVGKAISRNITVRESV
ncbi:MAG TPA: FeoA domain-containing protein [Candidatus Limivivens merdigallinarum]|uniref:FeoA domain-containing protein n=1 Tax=Candidatus Limivivens merdigallinarum TaxID=2840859 RepID=A0A9D1D1S7_9FIRM|nr:FeoA domain-containing protein [Candidatus Limivivens merdigallinarum]